MNVVTSKPCQFQLGTWVILSRSLVLTVSDLCKNEFCMHQCFYNAIF